MSRDFTYGGYRDLLGAFVERGYQVRGYADADRAQPHLILRHDIDMSLDAALPIAEIEGSLGLKAHYFVLLRTELYNVFSAGAREKLRKLTGLGHEIGLHLDTALYGNDASELQRAAEVECEVLEAAVGQAVRAISFHRPTKALLGHAEPFAGRPHAYQPRFYSEMGYCSDSRGDWHHGHPLDHPAVRERRALQLLTHPIWWTAVAQTAQAKLTSFLAGRFSALDTALAENCTVHRPGYTPRLSDTTE